MQDPDVHAIALTQVSFGDAFMISCCSTNQVLLTYFISPTPRSRSPGRVRLQSARQQTPFTRTESAHIHGSMYTRSTGTTRGQDLAERSSATAFPTAYHQHFSRSESPKDVGVIIMDDGGNPPGSSHTLCAGSEILLPGQKSAGCQSHFNHSVQIGICPSPTREPYPSSPRCPEVKPVCYQSQPSCTV